MATEHNTWNSILGLPIPSLSQTEVEEMSRYVIFPIFTTQVLSNFFSYLEILNGNYLKEQKTLSFHLLKGNSFRGEDIIS